MIEFFASSVYYHDAWFQIQLIAHAADADAASAPCVWNLLVSGSRVLNSHLFLVMQYPSPLNYGRFPKSVCTSVNECVCHGIPDDRPLQEVRTSSCLCLEKANPSYKELQCDIFYLVLYSMSFHSVC